MGRFRRVILKQARCFSDKKIRVVAGGFPDLYEEVVVEEEMRSHFFSWKRRLFLVILGLSFVWLEGFSRLALPVSSGALMEIETTLSPEEQQLRAALWEKAGYRRAEDYLTKPYSNDTVFALLEALKHRNWELKSDSLWLLSLVLQQFKVRPALIRETILPQVRPLVTASHKIQGDKQARRGRRVAELVVWHCEVNLITDPNRKRAFLAPSL